MGAQENCPLTWFAISTHAAERYIERFRPDLSLEEARHELRRIATEWYDSGKWNMSGDEESTYFWNTKMILATSPKTYGQHWIITVMKPVKADIPRLKVGKRPLGKNNKYYEGEYD